MQIKKKYFVSFFIILPNIIILLVAGLLIGAYLSIKGKDVIINDKFLSGYVEKAVEETPTPTEYFPSPTKIPATPTPTPTPIEYKISLIDSPTELMEGGQASFTWVLDGPFKTIHKSAIYFGTMNTEGILGKDVVPADTNYTDSVKDFLDGDYDIPIRFIGNTSITKPGEYYFRAYALIDGKNYWSEERLFKVKPKPIPGYKIKLVNYPQKVKLNENSPFTWEIIGPQTTIGFTAIVGGKDSKSGNLDETIDITRTPYKVLVKDFINGAYVIPLRYVGNAIMPEYGTYYIRALAVVNGKNIWSDEYPISVE